MPIDLGLRFFYFTKMTENKRKSLSKKLRFDLFKRDSFQCVYCGNRPPNVLLEIDHIIPHSKGGKDKIENLVTSCFDCNRGKSNRELTEVPNAISSEISQEKLIQYKTYIKYVKELQKIKTEELELVCAIFEKYNTGYTPSDNFRNTITQFLEKIGLEKTCYAMEVSCTKNYTSFKYNHNNNIFKYFCGICWNIFKEKSNGHI
jgi:hypothetical protein